MLAANTSISATSAAGTKSDVLDTGTTQKPPQSGRGIREHKEDGRIMHEWIPVTERLPKDAADVLICTIYNTIFTAHRYSVSFNGHIKEGWEDGAEWWEYDDAGVVTAWMPLPKPYKEGK